MIKNAIDFNIDNFLMDLDSKSIGIIDISSLSNYMNKKMKKNIFLSDLEVLYHELDIDQDGIVSYQDIRALLKLSSSNHITSPRRQTVLSTTNREKDYPITSTKIERKSLSNNYINDKTQIMKNYFDKIIKFENKAEEFKIELSKCEDVTTNNFLSLFHFKNGYVTFNDMRLFLVSNKIYTLDDELALLINRFDFDKDSKLNIEELVSILLPNTKEYSKLIEERNNSELSNITKSKIKELFRLLINNECEINKLNKHIENESDYFNLIKSQYREYIIPDDILSLGYTDFETHILFKRINKKKDKKITIEEVYIN